MRMVQERFEEKFVKGGGDDCWEWMGGKDTEGYGQITIDGKSQTAHRVAYQIYVGKIADGLCVCHHCDNPSCVRPDHLFLGTHADNMRDCMSKGRFVHPDNSGENHGLSKLTETKVRLIRSLSANGAHQADLAKQFEVNQSTISYIVHGKRWAKLLEEDT